jgi:hypothetical protein
MTQKGCEGKAKLAGSEYANLGDFGWRCGFRTHCDGEGWMYGIRRVGSVSDFQPHDLGGGDPMIAYQGH